MTTEFLVEMSFQGEYDIANTGYTLHSQRAYPVLNFLMQYPKRLWGV